MHPALFYLPGRRLSHSELSAARLDGLVFEVGEGYMPADIVEGADARATAVASLFRRGLAASGPSAAWIHGAGDAPPARHHAHRSGPRRVRMPADSRLLLHDTPVPAAELTSIAGVAVTTPARTLADLAVAIARHPDLGRWATSLAAIAPGATAAAIALIENRARMPGRRSALDRLRRLCCTPGAGEGQDEVTRYTS